MSKYGYTLTPEDSGIYRALAVPAAFRDGDWIDARAMAAIEVDREQRQRITPEEFADNPGTPADRVELWGDTGLREAIEAEVGEALL